jgi:hypothetical protein
MCEMPESTKETGKSVRQLLVIAALMVIGYTCVHTLRFTIGSINFILVCTFYAVPILAIPPVLRLHKRARTWGLVLLAPVLFLSSFLLLFTLFIVGLLGSSERTEPLQTFQLGSSTIELQRYDYGGAVGVHGLNLEQRRLICHGLYVVRSVDFFESAMQGTLSVEGPYRVRVHAKGNYYSNDYEVDRVYSLKPWVYF